MKELSKNEMRLIDGGNWLTDIGHWLGKTTAQIANFLAENPIQYNTTGMPYGPQPGPN